MSSIPVTNLVARTHCRAAVVVFVEDGDSGRERKGERVRECACECARE